MRFRMKTWGYFSLYLILLIIIFWMFQKTSLNSIEGFTPKMREIYRPYIRKIRVFSENVYNNTIDNVSTFFRKTGVL